jgi:hypothetical protein
MNLDTNTLATEISNALTATSEDYTTTVVDLDIYGASCEITKYGSNRKLHLTPVDDNLIDMILFDETGNTIASGTLFNEAVTDITPEELANLVTICL